MMEKPVETDQLPNLPGLDTQAGLAIVRGNRALYARLLNSFFNHYQDFEGKFRAAQADSNDPAAATREAHSLKGVAGNIGAPNLREKAYALELACKTESEGIEGALSAVLLELQSLIRGLQDFNAKKG